MRKIYLIVPILAAAAAGCGDSSDDSNGGSGGAGGAGGSEGTLVTVDTFNIALAGRFIEYEDERRGPLTEAIADMDSDIVCLQEVFEQTDKELIRAAAMDAFPYAVSFEDDLDTLVDDATDQNGEVPAPPAEGFVPCPAIVPANAMGETIEDQMNTAIDCVAGFCSTTGDDSGQMTDLDCAIVNCIEEVAPLLTGDAQQQQCYACAVTQLPNATFSEIRLSCPTVPNQLLSYDGQNGVMLLSRYPLSDEENWVIPGTWTRRVINRATAELPDGKELDVYCNHLTPLFSNPAFLYTGQYGGDAMSSSGQWEAEQFLQAEKLIDYVERSSGDRPAVILGDLNTGLAYPDQEIVAEGAPTLELLEQSFTPAYAEGYEPLCTFCGDNPMVGGGNDVWIDHILLHQLGPGAVRETERTFDEPVVEVETPDGPMDVPLSDHYGMRSVIAVP